MFSEIGHEEALEILQNGFQAFLDGKDEYEDNPHYDPDDYSKQQQDKMAAWRWGYRFAEEVYNDKET